MARTVTVELKMKVSDFQANGAKAIATMEALGAEVKTTGAKTTEFQRLVTANLKDGETAFQSLTRRSTELRTEIDKLRADFARTGDVGIFGNLKSAQSDLQKTERFIKNMAPEVAQAGANLGNTLLNGMESSISEFSFGPLGGPIGLGILAAAVPIIVSGLGAAISAGVSLGVVGLAAAIDRNNPVVVKAFGKLKDDAVGVFQGAAQPLAAPLASALTSLDGLLRKEEPEIKALFTSAGQSIGPLTAGLEKLTSDLLPALVKDAQSFNAAITDPQVQASLSAVESSFTGLLTELGDPGLVKEGFIALDATLGTTLTLLQGIVIASETIPNGVRYLKDAAGFIDKIFTAGPDTTTPALETRAQSFAKGVQATAKSASAATPQVAGFGHSLDAAGVAAGTSYPDIQAIGKSMDSMGEHAGTTTPAVQAIGKSMQSMGEHASTTIPAVDAIGKSMTSMGEHAGTANLATQAVGFSVKSLGEHAGTSDPAVLAVGKSMQSMGEHAGTANMATQAAGRAVQSMGEHAGLANPATDAIGKSMQSMGEHSGSATAAVKGLTSAQQKNTGATIGELQAFNALNVGLNETFDKYMAVDQAAISVKQAQADLRSELGKGKKSWDLNTQAGRDNYSQLLTSIQTDKNAYDSQVALNGATRQNTTAYDHNVESLLKIAKQAGLSSGQISKLRQQFEALPPAVNIPVNVRIRVTGSTGTAGIVGGLGGHTVSRWGGVYQPAADGLLSQAKVYPPVNPGRFMIAEPQTGGEAFIPKNGNYGRSMSILSAAAGWYGAHVVPSGMGGSQPAQFSLVVTGGDATGKFAVETLRFGIQQRGGDVVKVLSAR